MNKFLQGALSAIFFANQAIAEEVQGVTISEFENLTETEQAIYIKGLIDGIEATYDWTMLWTGEASKLYCVPERAFLDVKKMHELMQKYDDKQITIGLSIMTMDNIFCAKN